MPASPLNYFTCTLDQAAKWNSNHPHLFSTVNSLIDGQAKKTPDSLAVGFAAVHQNCAGHHGTDQNLPSKYTFYELKRHSEAAAHCLRETLQARGAHEPITVALLCASSPAFLLAWLGLMRLGYAVLLLAPQLEPSAIEHLCSACDTGSIFHDGTNAEKVHNAGQGLSTFSLEDVLDHLHLDSLPVDPIRQVKSSDVAYWFHTSGTSSGQPKPISQSHKAAVAVLPSLPGGDQAPTFSTTPLYHGGIADCFRAWTSGAAVWLFPEGQAPITAVTVRSCLDHADRAGGRPVKHFTSVPYVLQMLAEDENAVERLQKMDMVGVGGAALPLTVGDRLVERGVNLVSRYGSAECGFLMSSVRDFETDQEWQYLRQVEGQEEYLSFESRDEGLCELVVLPSWPHRAKTNRPDGSFATADLLEPHPQLPNAWRYHSRADAQITLANGKKFDPAPVETAILSATSGVLRDVLIFGSGKDFPGALLFTTKESPREDLLELLWPVIERMNRDTQGHARIPRFMLVVVQTEAGRQPLAKSSKGTVLRGQAEKKYAREIASAYQGKTETDGIEGHITRGKLLQVISTVFNQVLGRDIDPDQDVYRQGVDSIACVQIRGILKSKLLQDSKAPLPLNVIYDCGTIVGLVEDIMQRRQGHPISDTEKDVDELKNMVSLAEKYSHLRFDDVGISRQKPTGEVVVLTGATGALGVHLLHLLREEPNVRKIYCLLRASTPDAAHERVTKSLHGRGLPELDSHDDNSGDGKVVCLQCHLADTKLGLSRQDWDVLGEQTTTIIHAAWTVNFNLRLKSFEDHIAGTRHALDLALASRARLLFISSTASVAAAAQRPIPEQVLDDPSSSSPLGYSRSKWVAEQVCAAAWSQVATWTDLRRNGAPSDRRLSAMAPDISIVRVGQLCGNQAGIWNASEAFPLMLATAKVTGCLPDLPAQPLDWLPVDAAARAIWDIASSGRGGDAGVTEPQDLRMPVFHVLNWHAEPEWAATLRWLQADACDTRDGKAPDSSDRTGFDIVSASDWLHRLESVLNEDDESLVSTIMSQRARGLLSLWRTNYLSSSGDQSSISRSGFPTGAAAVDSPVTQQHAVQAYPQSAFATDRTTQVSRTIKELEPLDKESILKMWNWIQKNVT